MFSKILTKPGTAVNNKTGSWRSGKKPKWLHKNCIGCRTCYLLCPEGCVSGSKKTYDADLEFCKGCGICVLMCPAKDIEMVEE